MKRLTLLLVVSIGMISPQWSSAQCTTTDATDCSCDDGSQDCDLLPDITISWGSLENYLSGPTEYSQTGNGANNGRLRITGSTPNIGFGPLTVRGSDYFVCGTDTILGDPGTCPDGSSPRQLIVQRIYHKDGSTMTYYDRWAGAMTYHPTHGHNHVDDWGVFTLRYEDPNEPDPRKWPIVGNGAKLGFCLMDYGSCSAYPGDCLDTNMYYQQGDTLMNPDFPNWGLGGGNYNCSTVEQGISSGYTDIYSENLDGMWINIPPGTCNGDYWIVAVVDPHNNFLESDSTNNWTAIPITLTQQAAPGNPVAEISSDLGESFCQGQTATLTATGGYEYLWSTSDTTQSITTDTAGTYTVTVSSHCGTATSQSFDVTILPAPGNVTTVGDSICSGMSTTISATGTNVKWYDVGGYEVGTGNNFTTPSLTSTTTYYAADHNDVGGTIAYTGIYDNTTATGGYFGGDQWLFFDVLTPLTIESVKVYADQAGTRTISLLDNGGNLIGSAQANLPAGESRVNLGFDVPVGTNFELRANTNSGLYRSNTQVSFPYGIQDTISIHNSSAGGSFYYFFYDWEISVGSYSCAGPMEATTVFVDSCSGIDETSLSQNITLYPNPNNGNFTFEFDVPGTASFDYTIRDLMGKEVYRKHVGRTTGQYREDIDLQNISTGVYMLNILIDGRTVHKKLVIH